MYSVMLMEEGLSSEPTSVHIPCSFQPCDKSSHWPLGPVCTVCHLVLLRGWTGAKGEAGKCERSGGAAVSAQAAYRSGLARPSIGEAPLSTAASFHYIHNTDSEWWKTRSDATVLRKAPPTPYLHKTAIVENRKNHCSVGVFRVHGLRPEDTQKTAQLIFSAAPDCNHVKRPKDRLCVWNPYTLKRPIFSSFVLD